MQFQASSSLSDRGKLLKLLGAVNGKDEVKYKESTDLFKVLMIQLVGVYGSWGSVVDFGTVFTSLIVIKNNCYRSDSENI